LKVIESRRQRGGDVRHTEASHASQEIAPARVAQRRPAWKTSVFLVAGDICQAPSDSKGHRYQTNVRRPQVAAACGGWKFSTLRSPPSISVRRRSCHVASALRMSFAYVERL